MSDGKKKENVNVVEEEELPYDDTAARSCL